MRLTLMLAAAVTLPLGAQHPPLTSSDTALIRRILTAENRRDSADRALAEGERHADSTIQVLAWRARARITDPVFAARDSLPPMAAPPAWPEPAWRLRYRALAVQRSDCRNLLHALGDSAWHVRLRAVDLVDPACAADGCIEPPVCDSVTTQLRAWVDSLPADASTRESGNVSWHAAAHSIVALARLEPDSTDAIVRRLVTHRQWQVRLYAARAAAILSDTTTLRALVRDRNDNVKEVAIDALSALTGDDDDSLYVAALASRGAQAVRAAALALKDVPDYRARVAAYRVWEGWVAREIASARDARVALLEVTHRTIDDDRPPPLEPDLAPRTAALALGAEVKLRVTIAKASGGGTFVVRLRGDVAPIMAARILRLANARYYDGLTWQRVEPDFVIQGGSPGANEYVGYRQYLRDELGTVPHVRGTVGMSTRGHDTGDAQWFVNLRDNLRLDRDYTIFGEVIDGIEVVDGILEGDVIESIREVK